MDLFSPSKNKTLVVKYFFRLLGTVILVSSTIQLNSFAENKDSDEDKNYSNSCWIEAKAVFSAKGIVFREPKGPQMAKKSWDSLTDQEKADLKADGIDTQAKYTALLNKNKAKIDQYIADCAKLQKGSGNKCENLANEFNKTYKEAGKLCGKAGLSPGSGDIGSCASQIRLCEECAYNKEGTTTANCDSIEYEDENALKSIISIYRGKSVTSVHSDDKMYAEANRGLNCPAYFAEDLKDHKKEYSEKKKKLSELNKKINEAQSEADEAEAKMNATIADAQIEANNAIQKSKQKTKEISRMAENIHQETINNIIKKRNEITEVKQQINELALEARQANSEYLDKKAELSMQCYKEALTRVQQERSVALQKIAAGTYSTGQANSLFRSTGTSRKTKSKSKVYKYSLECKEGPSFKEQVKALQRIRNLKAEATKEQRTRLLQKEKQLKVEIRRMEELATIQSRRALEDIKANHEALQTQLNNLQTKIMNAQKEGANKKRSLTMKKMKLEYEYGKDKMELDSENAFLAVKVKTANNKSTELGSLAAASAEFYDTVTLAQNYMDKCECKCGSSEGTCNRVTTLLSNNGNIDCRRSGDSGTSEKAGTL